MDHRQQQQQADRDFPLELASQALAATEYISTLKATEWILKQRRPVESLKMSHSNARGAHPSQSRMDHYFLGGKAASSSQQGGSRIVTPFFGGGDKAIAYTEGERDSPNCRVLDDPEVGHGGSSPNGAIGRAGRGGFDGKSSPALAWRNFRSAHLDPEGDQEQIGSSGYGNEGERSGIRTLEPRYVLGNGVNSGVSTAAPMAKNDEAVGDSSVRLNRFTTQAGTVGIGAGSSGTKRQKEIAFDDGGPSTKRFKENATDTASPSRPPPPVFSTPQATEPTQQKVKVGSPGTGRNSLAPLAERMRPSTIEEIVGQEHLLGPRHLLRNLLNSDNVPSIILYGPPGTGKTSLARAIARAMPGLRFVRLSAVISGTKEVREVLEEAKRKQKFGQKTLLFLDEVHRFNKAQQDLFLHSIEGGQIIFIGATTENPSFEINPALRSRCQVLTLLKLEPEHLKKVLTRAIADRKKGLFASLPENVSIAASTGECDITVEEEALNYLTCAADGDARVALNALEAAIAAAYSETKLRNNTQSQNVGTPGAILSVRMNGVENAGSFGSSSSAAGKQELVGLANERFSDGFGSKRLEALRETAKECSNSKDDYSKPFKRFVGGKDVTPVYKIPKSDRELVPMSTGEAGKDGLALRILDTTAAERKGGINPDALVPLRADYDGSGSKGVVVAVTLAQVQEAFQRSHVLYDKSGEEHYNVISALHKSMRGGDADAAVYWLARMLEGGEGPLYVARRLIRFASEDVGLADPQAMGVAVACYQACHFLGMPECNVNLAQCVVYLARAPKSIVVYKAIEAAQKLIKGTHQNEPVPLHLRNASTQLMKEMGYGEGYVYPPGQVGRVEQEYMPPSLKGHKFLVWPEAEEE